MNHIRLLIMIGGLLPNSGLLEDPGLRFQVWAARPSRAFNRPWFGSIVMEVCGYIYIYIYICVCKYISAQVVPWVPNMGY